MEFDRATFDQPVWGSVNVLRIGDTLVDTGHVAGADALRRRLDGDLAGVERVLLTHPHVDHVGGSQTVDALADLPHVALEGVPSIVHEYADYLRAARADMTRLLAGLGVEDGQWDAYFPVREDYAEDAVAFERVLADGDGLRLGRHDCEVLHTPGHSAQHLALWHEPSGTCLTADLVSTNGHFMYGPLHCDVGDYKRSLRRVRALEPDRLVPMHGEPMADADERLADCLRKAERTERRLLGRLADGPFYAREFAIDDLGAEGFDVGFLTLVTHEFLAHLADRGELSVSVTDAGIRAEA